jgi:phage repressor protein C with HTH and peptisase S24 domain
MAETISIEQLQEVVSRAQYQRKTSIKDLCKELSINYNYLIQMLNGHRAVSNKVYQRFTDAFGQVAKLNVDLVRESAEVYKKLPSTMTHVVSDTSMVPHFKPGDQVIYNQSSMPYLIPGRPYLVSFGKVMFVRYVFREDEKILLKAESNWFPEIRIDPDDCKLYELVSLIRKLD